MRAMVAKYPGDRVLIGETYLPNTAELDKWYGGTAHNELQLPHGHAHRLPRRSRQAATRHDFRQHIEEVETQIHGSQPLIVFDNHDNVRAIDRYGDGVHDDQINKLLATMLFTTRATALMYYGEEIGMHTTTPTRREDVRDPIGITGWPKEKGRDGERTPMQWTPGPQAGFSTNPHTWLPIPPNYKTINVAVESKDPNSQLNWFKQLIALRRDVPALHSGNMTMLDTTNPDVLSYVRSAGSGPAVVVAMNFTAEPKTIALNLTGSGVTGTTVKTLAADDPPCNPLPPSPTSPCRRTQAGSQAYSSFVRCSVLAILWNRKHALFALLLLASLPVCAQSPSAADRARIRDYIHNAWDTLSRSMSECKSVVDPKVHQVPVLYLPADLPTPPAVEAMRKSCNVDVRHLPRVIHHIDEVPPSELPVEGLLYLPNRYVVPGGRFNEMYGWDSYFILLGLEHDGRRDLAKGMVENFFFEIANYGAILNANRTYYFTRSQPPFLSSMIREVYEHPAPGASLTSSG